MILLDLLTDPVRFPLALALLAAVLRVLYAIVSRFVAPYPRARALVEAVAAACPDVLRAGLQVVAAITGRPAPRLDVTPLDPQAARAINVAESWRLRAELAEARVAELTAAEEPGRLRPTVVPGEEPARSPDEASHAARTGRHRIPPGTMGALCLAFALALPGCGAGGADALRIALKALAAASAIGEELGRRDSGGCEAHPVPTAAPVVDAGAPAPGGG